MRCNDPRGLFHLGESFLLSCPRDYSYSRITPSFRSPLEWAVLNERTHAIVLHCWIFPLLSEKWVRDVRTYTLHRAWVDNSIGRQSLPLSLPFHLHPFLSSFLLSLGKWPEKANWWTGNVLPPPHSLISSLLPLSIPFPSLISFGPMITMWFIMIRL